MKENIQNLIKKSIPNLSIKEMKFLGAGASYHVYEVNKRWIFRFAQHQNASLKLQKEIKILPLLKNFLPLQIPEFIYQGQQADGNWFVGYKKITGLLLTKDLFESLPAKKQQIILKDLSGFLHKLHAFPLKKAFNCGIEHYDLKQACTEDLKDFKKFSPQVQEKQVYSYSVSFLKNFVKRKENFSNKKALVHADLSSNHLFLDPKTSCLKAIIDWGEVQIADPDFDLAFYIYPTFGEDFTVRLISYLKPDRNSLQIAKLLEKFKNLHTLRLIQHLLFALKNNNTMLKNYHLSELKTAINKGF